jgi:hypothetical protein
VPARAFSPAFGPAFGGSLNVATIALKVGPGAGYEDGDILCAFNRRAIRCVHAQHICHVKAAARNGDGLLLLTHHARDWFEHTHQYRFERISATEIRRTDLTTLAEDVLSGTPNEAGEHIDVPLFIERRKQQAGHYLFGTDGAEVWYGGSKDFSHAKLDLVWIAIETKTPQREADFPDWPAGIQDLKSHLFLRMNDMDDDAAQTLVAPAMDGPTVVSKRARKVSWRDHRELTAHIANIDDPTVSVDLRPSVGRLARTIHDVLKGDG